MPTTSAGSLLRFGSRLAAVLIAAVLTAPASGQQATPTTTLALWVTEERTPFPMLGATVCVSPDPSEPAFWGKWLVPIVPPTGLVFPQNIPLPPWMIGEPITVTIAESRHQQVATTDALSTFQLVYTAPGTFTFRHVKLPRGSSSGDCGTPPRDPLGPAVGMMIDPPNETASSGDVVTFTLHWSAYAFAERWYLYDWVIDDPSIARPMAPSQTTELKVEAVAPGTTRITARLLRPDGTTKESQWAWIKVEQRAPPPPPPPPPELHAFGWETPIEQRDMNDFNLPHACAVGMNLEQIVHARPTTNPPGCSIRTNATETCSSCHRMGATPPTLQGIQKSAFCNQVLNFVGNPTKPQNLKNFFQDWYDRRDPATGECPD